MGRLQAALQSSYGFTAGSIIPPACRLQLYDYNHVIYRPHCVINTVSSRAKGEQLVILGRYRSFSLPPARTATLLVLYLAGR